MSRRSSKRAEKLDISYDLDTPSDDLVEVYSTMFAPANPVEPFPAPPVSTESKEDIAPQFTVGAEAEPPLTAGCESASTVCAASKSTVYGDFSSTVGVVSTSAVDTGASPHRKSTDLLPFQRESNPGLAADAESAPTIHPASRSMVDGRSTVDDCSAITVDLGLSPPQSLGGFWITEGKEGIFRASRVRPIARAQDALTHPEESVYDLLWGPKNQSEEPLRYTTAGYEKIAAGARIAKENAKKIIARLIYKGFLRIETPPDYLHRIPTKYAVYSYSTALDNMRRANRRYVVRTGNGVLFAHPMRSTHTVDAE